MSFRTLFRRPATPEPVAPAVDWDAAELFWASQGKSQLR